MFRLAFQRGRSVREGHLRHLKASLTRAVRRGRLATNPGMLVSMIRLAEPEKRTLKAEEEVRLLLPCSDPVMAAFVRTALSIGCRLGELFHLEWADLLEPTAEGARPAGGAQGVRRPQQHRHDDAPLRWDRGGGRAGACTRGASYEAW